MKYILSLLPYEFKSGESASASSRRNSEFEVVRCPDAVHEICSFVFVTVTSTSKTPLCWEINNGRLNRVV